MPKTATRKSLEPKVFQLGSGAKGDALIGSKCQTCNRVYFPARDWCAACSKPTCKSVELSRQGVLRSYALVFRRQSYAVIPIPYLLAEIALPEGILVYTTLNLTSTPSTEGPSLTSSIGPDDLGQVQLGTKVTLDPIVVKKDEEGHDLVAYNFRLVNS